MDETPQGQSRPKGQSREERLAAALRENLKRRKAQSRALGGQDAAALPKPGPKS